MVTCDGWTSTREWVMRAFCFLVVGVVAGCGVEQGPLGSEGQGTDPAPVAPAAVGTVSERAQFADATLINEVQLQSNGMSLLINSDGNPVTIQIFYSADKTTDTGRTAAAPVLKNTISLNTDQTAKVDVDLNDAAFSGFYGSIFLNAIGSGPLDVFQTFVQSGFDMWSTGGSVFQGGSYRIPYWSGCTGVVIAVTNQSNFAFDVQFANIGHADAHTISQLVPFSTYLFDSRRYNWTTTGNNSVQITTNGGGTVALTAYEYRGNTNKYRVVPVKAAPYP
jgi:hypothetical protein